MTGRRVVASLLALVLSLAGLTSAAVAQEPEAPAVEPTLELVERPRWAQPDDRLSFVIATTGDPATTSVQVEVFSALGSVAQLERSATTDVGVRLSRTPPATVEALPAGPDGTRVATLAISAEFVDGLTTQIVSAGVHPVVISLLGERGEVLDEVRTPLVRLPEEGERWPAPDLAVLLDVAAPPTLGPDGTRSLPAALLARLGHVGALLAAHPDLDLTVAVVPDTLDALATLDDPAAALLLDRLTDRDLLVAPYVRLPVQELVAHGLDGLIPPLLDRGTAVIADRLGTEPRRRVWDGDAPVGTRGGAVLDELGFRRVVVPSRSVRRGDDLAALVDAGPVPVLGTGPVLGIVSDAPLSREVAESLDDAVGAAHVELARYLLRPAEADPSDDPDERATVLVRPGPLPGDSVLAGLLRLLDHPEAPVQVGGLGLVDAAPDARDDEAEPLAWSPATTPDLRPVARRVLTVSARLDTFESMTGPSPRADDLRLQVATAVGASTPAAGRDDAVAAVEHALAAAFDGVHLSGQTDLNLTSRQGTLPVTVENANPFPVEVLVRVRSERLAFPGGEGVRAESVALPTTVAANDIRRIDVPVEARATGSVPVFVELWSPDDGVQLDDLRLNVRSTAISGVGLVLSVGALVVLLAWWARHSLATRRARATASAAPSEAGPEPMG